jgi:hypothetical protein
MTSRLLLEPTTHLCLHSADSAVQVVPVLLRCPPLIRSSRWTTFRSENRRLCDVIITLQLWARYHCKEQNGLRDRHLQLLSLILLYRTLRRHHHHHHRHGSPMRLSLQNRCVRFKAVNRFNSQSLLVQMMTVLLQTTVVTLKRLYSNKRMPRNFHHYPTQPHRPFWPGNHPDPWTRRNRLGNQLALGGPASMLRQ